MIWVGICRRWKLRNTGCTIRLDPPPPSTSQGLKSLVDVIRVRARPKQYAGATSTGSMLAGLAEAFVKAINEGAVPVIANTWQVGPDQHQVHCCACILYLLPDFLCCVLHTCPPTLVRSASFGSCTLHVRRMLCLHGVG